MTLCASLLLSILKLNRGVDENKKNGQLYNGQAAPLEEVLLISGHGAVSSLNHTE